MPRITAKQATPVCVVFDVARVRGGHQIAGLNKSGSSIFGSQTANTTPTDPCYCFCILGDPAERLASFTFLTSRARAGHQTARLNKSGSSIFGLTANTTPTNPC